MSMDDEIGMKELDGPSGDEVRAIWTALIRELQIGSVCFYPGPQGDALDFQDFTYALPHIGRCGALVYSAPHLTKHDARNQVKWNKDNLMFDVPGLGTVIDIEMLDTGDMPVVDREMLFQQPPATEWISPANGQPLPAPTPPDEARLWGDYCRVKVGGRLLHMLHIGIGGGAAWAWFLRPHAIHPARIIANPPYQ